MTGPMVRKRSLATLLFLAVGLLLALGVYKVTADYELRQVTAQYDHVIDRYVGAVERTVGTYVEALYALRSFFECSEVVTREEFSQFASGALERHPKVQAFEWAVRVPLASRQAHEANTRAAGLKGYVIRETDADGNLVPAASREVYYPVFYVEPLAGNAGALGVDLGSEAQRREALLRAIRTGQASASGTIRLVQEPTRSDAILVFLPILDSAAATQDQAKGCVLLVVHLDDILQEAHALVGGALAPALAPALVDTAADVPESLRHDDVRRRSIQIGGRVWALDARPTSALRSQARRWPPYAFAVGTLGLWMLLGGVLFLALRRAADQALHEQERLVQRVFRGLSEGVIVADANRRVVWANEAAEKFTGVRDSQLMGGEDTGVPYAWYYRDAETPYPADQLPLARVLRGEEVEAAEVYVNNGPSRSGARLMVSGSPLRDEHGVVTAGVVVLRDITEHRKSREVIRRLFQAVQTTDDTVFTTDRQGRIEYVNPAWERTTGYSRSEVLGKTPTMLRSGEHDEDYYKKLWATILSGETFRSTVINRKKNGDLYYGDQTITPMKSPSGQVTHFVAVVKDTTEQRERQARAAEMRIASLIQQRLYPQSAPVAEGFDISGAVFPADATCGDYFDFIPIQEDLLGLVIGDVSGHGVGPALIMAQTRAYLRSLAQTQGDPCDVLERLNDTLVQDIKEGNFVSLIFATLDFTTGQVAYANAGHPPGYVLDRSGGLKAELRGTGPILGCFPDHPHERHPPVKLEVGDLLILYTDGVTESSPDGEHFFENDRVVDVVRAHRGRLAQDIVAELHKEARAFAGGRPQDDDIAIVVIRRIEP